MSDKAFFSALDQVMTAMIQNAEGYVEEHHVTTQKLISKASKSGISLTPQKAMRLIRAQEAAGKLKYDGKRLTLETKKLINVWVAVELASASPPTEESYKRRNDPSR